jgi:hypothetical protein
MLISYSLRLDGTYECSHIQRQVDTIAKLSSYSAVLEHWIHCRRVRRDRSRLEVLHVLANAHCFSRNAELLLDGIPWCNGACDCVCSEKVPGVETRKKLDGSKDLVATNCIDVNCRNGRTATKIHLPVVATKRR